MIGNLYKIPVKGWVVWYNEDKELPLSPGDETRDLKDGMEVEFEIEDFWETGLEEVFKVAKLK